MSTISLTPEQRAELRQAITEADNVATQAAVARGIDYATFVGDHLAPLVERWLDEARNQEK